MEIILDMLRKAKTPEELEEEKNHILGYIRNWLSYPDLAGELLGWFMTIPDERDLVEIQKRALSQYRELKAYYPTNPSEIAEAEATLQKNIETLRKLAAMSFEERGRLQIHEYPPFCIDFKAALMHGVDKPGYHEIPLRAFTPTTEVVGKGGFGTVYLACGNSGEEYALKVFFPTKLIPNVFERAGKSEKIYKILANLRSKAHKTNQSELFTKLKIVPDCAYPEWYLAERAKGSGITSLLSKKNKKRKDKDLITRALITYASMLHYLHSQGLIYVDNDWSAVVVSEEEEEARVCDLDFISSLKEINTPWHFARKVGHLKYLSREQICSATLEDCEYLLGSDLEGLALMVDELVIGVPFLPLQIKQRLKYEKEAKANKRTYPRERAQKIPKKLRPVIQGLLTYPRDDSITARDFLTAIRLVYDR